MTTGPDPSPVRATQPTCPHGDPTCPCPDGLACHYETYPGSPAMPCAHCGTAPGEPGDDGRKETRFTWLRNESRDLHNKRPDLPRWLIWCGLALCSRSGARPWWFAPVTVTHRCPDEGSGLMPCCGRTPFEVPRTDRLTIDGTVTCRD